MAVERPTFSESWHRVAELKPRLRAAVRNFRQYYRGRMWHVLADPANNQFFRLDDAAYHFVALLDGRRTVAEAWKISNEDLGDRAPTQGEAIQLLGQLYMSNLLQAELPPDSQQMFSRYSKRVNREIGSYLMNFLFIRIPLFDPQPLLRATTHLFGWVFSPVGFGLWCALLGVAFYMLTGHWSELWEAAQPQSLLDKGNLILLYLCFAGIKAIHEMGHAYSCAHFGRKGGTGGAVHTIGIMFLVFMPVPYVDASSSWSFRNKWHRAIVGAAGMYVEMAVAAVAAIVWINTQPGLLNDIAYNLMFIASISTLLFNGNPLLRYDGYYILSDILEIANLAQRSKQYLHYLGKRYLFGVQRARSSAHSAGERGWLATYGVTSFVYRVIICVGILIYVSKMFFFIGMIMAFSALVTWVIWPIIKFFKYLILGEELERTRTRASIVTTALLGLTFVMIGVLEFPDRGRAEGVVEPRRYAVIHTGAPGFVDSVLPSGVKVSPQGPPILQAHNKELQAELDQVSAMLDAARIQREQARGQDQAAMRILEERIKALETRSNRAQSQIAAMEIKAPFEGTWVSGRSEKVAGVYLPRGERMGVVADPTALFVRVAVDQGLGPRLREHHKVELRVRGRSELLMTGTIHRILPAGQTQLPSPALGLTAGGSLRVNLQDQQGVTSAEPFFEIHITPDEQYMSQLLTGQRMVARFETEPRPLAEQWWRAARQLVQRRFTLSPEQQHPLQ